MPDSRLGARTAIIRRLQRKFQRPRLITSSSNGRLHTALLLALAVIALAALRVSFTPHQIAAQEPADSHSLLAVTDGLAAALRVQTGAIASALASAGAPSGERAAILSVGGRPIPGSGLVPRPLLIAAAQTLAKGVLTDPNNQFIIPSQRPVQFTVHEEGLVSSFASARRTVGQALTAHGIVLGPGDLVLPSPHAPLTAGMHVFVEHANEVSLSVGGQERTAYTHAPTVADLLAEQGIVLEGQDRVSPEPSAPVRRGLSVVVTLVRENVEFSEESIPYRTLYQNDPLLLRGKEQLIQAGSEGYIHREYRVVYENGAEISRELVRETTVPANDEIIARGTRVPIQILITTVGDLECARKLTVYATWYTAASAGGSGTTATGTAVYKGIVAVDPRVIPLGTRMYIPGYGPGIAADTGGAIIGNIIDLGFGPDDPHDWVSGWVEICLF